MPFKELKIISFEVNPKREKCDTPDAFTVTVEIAGTTDEQRAEYRLYIYDQVTFEEDDILDKSDEERFPKNLYLFR